jgi:hypothetical protein
MHRVVLFCNFVRWFDSSGKSHLIDLYYAGGNLFPFLVSNAPEDARTSHPCESGASFLK